MPHRLRAARILVRAALQDLRQAPVLVHALTEPLGESRVLVRTLVGNILGPQVLVGRVAHGRSPNKQQPQQHAMRHVAVAFGVDIKVVKMLADITREGDIWMCNCVQVAQSDAQPPGELRRAGANGPEKPNRLAG